MSWNVWGAGTFRQHQVLDRIRMQKGVFLAGLQECKNISPRMTLAEGWRLIRSADKLAGILCRSSVPIRYTSTSQKRCVIVVLQNLILISAYFPHEGRKHVEEEVEQLVRTIRLEIQKARQHFSKEGGDAFEVILMADANVELPANIEGEEGRHITGGGLRGDIRAGGVAGGFETMRERRKRHMRRALLDLLLDLKLVATNTFGDREPTHFTRRFQVPLVLDYIFAPEWWEKSSTVWIDKRNTGNETSDHAALLIQVPEMVAPRKRPRPRRRIHKAW